MKKVVKLWYQVYEKDGIYNGVEPYFYPSKDFEWVQTLKEGFTIMVEELQPLIDSNDDALTTYFRGESQNKKGAWKTTGLKFWGRDHKKNLKKFPKTAAILSSIPNLVGATFNLLEGGGHILPHCGETNGNIRCQIPFKVPAGLPDCGFKVGNESNPWVKGEPLLFTDAQLHTAWNNTDETRYIMIIDVIRPEFTNQSYQICCNVMAMQSFAILMNVLNINVKSVPYFLRLLIYLPILLFWFLYMPVHRKFGHIIYGT